MSLPRPVCTASEPAAPSPALSPALHTLCCPLQSHTLSSQPWRCPCLRGSSTTPYPVTTRSVPSALSLLSASVALDYLRRSQRPCRLYCTAVLYCCMPLYCCSTVLQYRDMVQQDGGARLQTGRAVSCSAGLWSRSPPAAAGRAPRIRARRTLAVPASQLRKR